MSRTLRWQLAAVGALVLFFGWMDAANFMDEERRQEAWYIADDGVRLGLDLRGGIHWVLSPQFHVGYLQELRSFAVGFEKAFKDENIRVDGVRVDEENEQILIETVNSTDLPRVREMIDDGGTLRIVSDESGTLTLGLTEAWYDEVRERSMLQVLEVLRRRITDSVPESVVARQGRERVLVQIPGGHLDRARARKLLEQTGRLEFRIVQETALSEDLLHARYPDGLPEGTEILFEKEKETGRVVQAHLLPKAADITGKYLTDARLAFDSRNQEWIVEFQWNREGATIFGDLTEANVNKPLAIVLENDVVSAPVIRSRISTRGQISGNFSSEDARDLAIILRSGALPIPTEIEEERTVGPALGADSIRRGVNASIVGLILVLAFTIGYYRLSGGYAAFALMANLVLVVGIMSLAGATLTLPGIAGVVLTVGMAIDANVIIFERIREELRQGKTPRAAIATGFSKARWTILDANITTLITAIILYEFGTGPIKGFAVTLSIGIVTSVFAALVITRLLFQVHPGTRYVEQLSI